MPVFQNEWPSGNYGLPKPRTGCPDRSWREGFRYHDSENAENTNWKSNKSHLSGNVTLHGIRQEFCIHLNTRNEQIPWPRGKYCIYKKGGTCPFGLHEGMLVFLYMTWAEVIVSTLRRTSTDNHPANPIPSSYGRCHDSKSTKESPFHRVVRSWRKPLAVRYSWK